MEDTVMMNAGLEETAAGDASQEISAAELLGEEQQQEPAETVKEGGDGPEQETQPDQQEKEERANVYAGMERSIRQRYQREYEQKLQSDPVMQIGRDIVEDIMQVTGATREEAIRLANENFVNAVAKRENVSPMIARSLKQRQQPQENKDPDIYERAAQIHRDMEKMELPSGFDFEAAKQDIAFAEMLLNMPTEVAVWKYHAQQAEKRAKSAPEEMAERIKARATIPQPMKPQQPVTPKIDFDAMTDEEFFKFEEKVKAARAQGKTVRF